MGPDKIKNAAPAPSTNWSKKKKLSFLCFIKELTDEIMRSYMLKIMDMVPPLTPGISMEPPMINPLIIVEISNILSAFLIFSLELCKQDDVKLIPL